MDLCSITASASVGGCVCCYVGAAGGLSMVMACCHTATQVRTNRQRADARHRCRLRSLCGVEMNLSRKESSAPGYCRARRYRALYSKFVLSQVSKIVHLVLRARSRGAPLLLHKDPPDPPPREPLVEGRVLPEVTRGQRGVVHRTDAPLRLRGVIKRVSRE